MKTCAVYTRVSTDNQAEKEFSSCEAQLEKIKSFIKSQEGWEIFKAYNDPGYTGANVDRPALQNLLNDIPQYKIDMVLVYKIDRLTRSPKDFYYLIEQFEKYGVNFLSITERFDTSTPAGRLLRNIMLTFAQFERELVSERVKDKILERAKKGMWNSGQLPYGYKKADKKLVIETEEARIVKMIYESYLSSGSFARVYEELKEKRIFNRQGKVFMKSQLFYMLKNITYTARIEYNGIIYKAIHEPIITDEVFSQAQLLHKKKTRKFLVCKNFLLAGLVKCKECGSTMSTSFTNKKHNGKMKRYNYYRCSILNKKDWNACSTKMVSSKKLENYLFESLKRISLDNSYIESLIFSLNFKAYGHQKRFELSESPVKYSPEILQNILKTIHSEWSKLNWAEINLFLRRHIKEIIYSPAEIQINLYYNPSDSAETDFPDEKNEFLDRVSWRGGDQRPASCGMLGTAESAGVGSITTLLRDGNQGKSLVCDQRVSAVRKMPSNFISLIIPNIIHKDKKKIRI